MPWLFLPTQEKMRLKATSSLEKGHETYLNA